MFSDEMIGLDIAHRREMRAATGRAQSIIDELDTDVKRLQRKLAAAYAEIETERARRIAAEMRLERILDMPLN